MVRITESFRYTDTGTDTLIVEGSLVDGPAAEIALRCGFGIEEGAPGAKGRKAKAIQAAPENK